jgi:hypothetical protein
MNNSLVFIGKQGRRTPSLSPVGVRAGIPSPGTGILFVFLKPPVSVFKSHKDEHFFEISSCHRYQKLLQCDSDIIFSPNTEPTPYFIEHII